MGTEKNLDAHLERLATAEREERLAELRAQQATMQLAFSGTAPEPKYRRILVRRDDPEELTRGGIHIPENARTKKSRGVVIAVNSGHQANEGGLLECESKPGDYVLFGTYSGTDLDGDKDLGRPELGRLVVMQESEVLLTLERAYERATRIDNELTALQALDREPLEA